MRREKMFDTGWITSVFRRSAGAAGGRRREEVQLYARPPDRRHRRHPRGAARVGRNRWPAETLIRVWSVARHGVAPILPSAHRARDASTVRAG